MSTEIAKKQESTSIRGWLGSPKFKQEIAKVLPAHVTPERMIRTALTATLRVPNLAKCDESSFFQCMMQLSQLGLEPDGRRAHLIPFLNRKQNRYECQLVIDYKGIVDLILRTGKVSAIHCDKICDNDDFEYDCGTVVKHKINFREPRGNAYAYICIITLKDGSRKCEVMTLGEVESIRNRSQAKTGPWQTDFDEMAKKTVFKRAAKWVEWSTEVKQAIDADDGPFVDYESSFPAGLLGGQSEPRDQSAGEISDEEFSVRQTVDKAMTVGALNASRSLVADSNLPANIKAELYGEISDKLVALEEIMEPESSTNQS